ncbi:MAG: pyridoxamine 5'-phosphate oxidase family protein [Nitrosopumilus sp.]
MVKISEDVKQLIRNEGVIIVGTSDELGLSNISPRSTFHVTDDEIYWFELFKHKSYDNFMRNPLVSVAVFDRNELNGYQLKGKVSIVTDKEEFYYADLRIQDRLVRLHKKNILKLIAKHSHNIIKFTPNIIYSLKPFEFADVPGVLDADVDLGRLVGGVNLKSSFGLDKHDIENSSD